MENGLELNGLSVDRETMRAWLQNKHIALWGDFLIGKEKDQDRAIDWLMGQMQQLHNFALSQKAETNGHSKATLVAV